MQRPAAPPGDAHAYIGAERARDPPCRRGSRHRPGLRSAAARRRNPLPNPRPGRNRAGAIPAARSRPRRLGRARWRASVWAALARVSAITRSAACMASATTGDNWRPWRAEPAICIRFSDAPASSTAMASGSTLWWVCKSDSTSTSMPGRAAPAGSPPCGRSSVSAAYACRALKRLAPRRRRPGPAPGRPRAPGCPGRAQARRRRCTAAPGTGSHCRESPLSPGSPPWYAACTICAARSPAGS